MRKPSSRGLDKFIVRLPDGMRDQISEAAKAANRTMNAEIVARLEWSFKAGKKRASGGLEFIAMAKGFAAASEHDRWQDHEKRIAALEIAIAKGRK